MNWQKRVCLHNTSVKIKKKFVRWRKVFTRRSPLFLWVAPLSLFLVLSKEISEHENSNRKNDRKVVPYHCQHSCYRLHLWPCKKFSWCSSCNSMGVVSIDCFIRTLVMEGTCFKKMAQKKKIEQNIENIYCSVFIITCRLSLDKKSFELTLSVFIMWWTQYFNLKSND